ncbi:hotdog fold thioesterase [Pasteurella atlantica]|uniref:Hotdog fold thioesterase n=2 Tax=Pasteurellaceae TaxID=712 RepID=A0ACC6HK67_9PAST|nr:hotdog fold thioesterase [Pasteurella atlantica]MDP8051188.1 hotdog fold thioesterase [Pasteurella atlantica]MDP8098870.1 hotdog fold thioesterase [Pasteurella atlantica]MDP8100188.1 hotdog fold thioesterase [Pasteurella atlantica]MDP8104483.1 hotdog fold thioesterase [Pasteurella atlantica]MDP8106897.1 hotdog fold thioesterase [Pasteurella atlantica]
MSIWKKEPNIEELNQLCKNCAVAHLGVTFNDFGNNWLSAKLTVDHRTVQPFGLLHGGVSAFIAETLGSAASLLCCSANQIPVGKKLTIEHLKPIKSGYVNAVARPVKLDENQHIWEISQYNEQKECCAISQLVVKIIEK